MSRRHRTAAALIAAASLLVTSIVVAPVALADDALYPNDGTGTAPTINDSVPAWEPALGRGTPLAPGTDATVPVPAAGAHSALVRLTVTRAPEPSLLSVAGFPALSVPEGGSATSTVLAPIVDGAVVLTSDGATEPRVEVLASFAASTEAPGAVRALPEAAVRADSASDLAVPSTGLQAGQGTTIGIVEFGEVPADPSQDTRAAFLSAHVSTPAGAHLILDGQELLVPAGSHVLSTVVTPDELGTVDLTVTEGSLSAVHLAVTGYVNEPADNPQALQGLGAFVPAPGAAPVHITATADPHTEPDLATPPSAVASLQVVSGARAESLAVLAVDEPADGRTQGLIVDGTRGAAPQLVLVDGPGSTFSRGSNVSATVLELGQLLTEPTSVDAEPEIIITSPDAGSVDASDTWTFDFAGTIRTPGDVPQRIEVTVDGEPYGSGHLRPDGGWGFTAAMPAGGDYEFGFTLVTRGGGRMSTTWAGTIQVPAPDDVVVTQDTVVLDDDRHAHVLEHTDTSVTFDDDPRLAPGAVIVAGVSEGTPEGFLGRVVSTDIIDDQWVVNTRAASLTDVFLQADVSTRVDVNDGTPVEVRDEGQETIVNGAVVDGDPVDAQWDSVPVDDLDLDPLSQRVEDEESAAVEGLTDEGPTGEGHAETASTMGTMAAPLATLQTGESIKAQFSAGSNASVSAEAALLLELHLTVDIEAAWTQGSWWPPIPPVPYPVLREFATILESTAKASATAQATVSADWSWSQSKGVSKNFAPITFAIGPVPMVITSEVGIELQAQVSISGSASATLSTAYQRTQELGFRFRDGTASLVDPTPRTTLESPSFSEDSGISASFSASAGPTLTFTALVWGFAGPEIALSLQAALDAQASATFEDPFLTASAELAIVGGFGVNVLVTVPVIDLELLNETLLEQEKKWVLWSGEFDLRNLLTPPDPGPGPPVPDPDEDENDYDQGDRLIPADEITDAVDIIGADVTAAYFVEGPPHESAFDIRSTPTGGFPTVGDDYIAMSTGDTGRLDGTGTSGVPTFQDVPSERGERVFDVTTIRLDLSIPTGVNCLVGLDFRFYSDEYPEFVGSDFNDAFIAEFGRTSWEVDGAEIYAPRNFAFDMLGNPITINAAGPYSINEDNAAGTPYGGATQLLRATTPVLAGDTSLYLSIFDLGDEAYDSTVLIDRIEFDSVHDPATQCAAGVIED